MASNDENPPEELPLSFREEAEMFDRLLKRLAEIDDEE